MYLGNPLLPINLTATSAADSVKKELGKRFWRGYELRPLKLNLVPYFLFNYHYYLEQDPQGNKSIKKSTHGILALDGHGIAVREDLVELIKHNWKKGTPIVPKGEFYEKWNNVGKREQDAVLALKTAEYFGVPKSNVVTSAARQVFIPFYKTGVSLGGKEYNLIINAVDGTIEGIKNIPQREKGYLEITRETVDELRDPKNWLKYSQEAVVGAMEGTSSRIKEGVMPAVRGKEKKDRLAVFESEVILVLIMVLAALLIIFSVFRIRLF